MEVLLSIKPEFANKIFNWEKIYEFRKSIFKNNWIKKIIVYSSSPVQKVIWEFEIDFIIAESPKSLWKKTKKWSWISETFFYKYFENKEIGYAIKIKKSKIYKEPKCIKKDYNKIPPQSFLYLA